MRFVFRFVVCSLFTIGFLSCTQQPEDIAMKQYELQARYFLTSDSTLGSLELNIEVELPEKFHNKEVLRNVQQQLVGKIFGEIYNSFPIESVLPKYAAMMRSEYIRVNDPYIEQLKDTPGATSVFQNQIMIQGVAMYADTRLLSYSYERFANMGSSDGNNSRMLYNYNLENALPIKEVDIFVANYEPSLKQLLKKQILADHVEVSSVGDLQDFQYYEEQIKPNNNFYLTAEGIVYVFNPYEITPYSMGQTAVLLTYNQLRPILKKNNPIAYIYKEPIEYEK